jgi:hypothetical protein
MRSRETDEILQVQGFFWKQLRARGWKEINNTLVSAIFRDGRRVIVVGNQPDDSLHWIASPSIEPDQFTDPLLGYTGAREPTRVAVFDIKGAPGRCRVVMNVLDKIQQFSQESFFSGPMEEAFDRLLEESVQRIDDFIAGGETIN